MLRLRLTDEPGWHATIDGKPLGLETFARVMLQAHIPAGHHTVEIYYWPEAFSAGIFLAVVSALGLGIACVVESTCRRAKNRPLRKSAESELKSSLPCDVE